MTQGYTAIFAVVFLPREGGLTTVAYFRTQSGATEQASYLNSLEHIGHYDVQTIGVINK